MSESFALSEDILSHIYQFVPHEDIATCLRLVSRAWRLVRVSLKHLQVPDERNLDILLSIPTSQVLELECDYEFDSSSIELMKILPGIFPDMKSLAFNGMRQFPSGPMIFDGVSQNTKLNELILFDCEQVNDKVLEQLLVVFCNLTNLDIQYCTITDECMPRIASTKLLDLKISCEFVTDRGLACLQGMPLQRLQVITGSSMQDEENVITTSWLSCGFRDLTVLTLEEITVSDELFLCSNLRLLALIRCVIELSEKSFHECFPRLKSLKFDVFCFNLDPCYYENCVGVKHLMLSHGIPKQNSFRHVSGLINLETLQVCHFRFAAEEMKYFQFSKLKVLSLLGCEFDFCEFVYNVPIGCPRIEALDLSDCASQLLGDRIMLIIHSFPSLRVLTISEKCISLDVKLFAEKRRVLLKFNSLKYQ